MPAFPWRFGLFGVLVLLLAACGSGNSATNLKANPSELTFLLASQDGLSQMVVGGGRNAVLKWDSQTYPLDPVISPDGKTIAFALQVPAKPLANGDVDFGSDLYMAGADGKNERLLLKHAKIAEFIRTPAFISDKELLYTVRGRTDNGRADFRIERMDLSTKKSSRFIEWGVDPAISKDGQKVVWDQIDPDSQQEALTVAGIDLQSRKVLVDAKSKLSLFSSQVFSPDGTKIAFAAVDLNSLAPGGSLPLSHASGVFAAHPFAQDVWIVNTDGTGLRRLAEIAENMPSISWSGDGSTVYALGPSALWKIDAATGQADQIAQGIPLGQIVWLSGS
jgi:Tol biopolymer transport system component